MTRGVFINRLRLSDFRNYEALALNFEHKHVVFTGHNGAGKTNLLEAISFLAPGRGMRRSPYADVTRDRAGGPFTVFAEIDGMAGNVNIGTSAGASPVSSNGMEADGSTGSIRRIKINGTASSADALSDHLRVIWITPALDGLFTGPAAERRRFLDRMVLTIDPSHGRRALNYENAMRSRNRLLADGLADPVWIEAVERQMAELGIAMDTARRELLSLLAREIDEDALDEPDTRHFPTARFALEGFMDDVTLQQGSSLDREECYQALLQRGRMRDAAAGRTLEGPHRVDLKVFHQAKNIEAARASTGEQKALLIGFMLAHARLVARMTGHAPVLLMDEIAAHLDDKRRRSLFDLVDELGGQAFMTGTDATMFGDLGARAQLFFVEDGAVTRLHDLPEAAIHARQKKAM